MDVIVLGGGLMGSSAAFFLARRGIKTRLIEHSHIGAGATVASFGNIRRTGRYLPQLPLAHRSLGLWNQSQKLLGRDIEFRATGHLRLIFDEDSLHDMRRFANDAKPWGFEIEEIGKAEIANRFPGLGPSAIAASFSPNDGSANPRLSAPAFADAAARNGVGIVSQANVCSVTHNGKCFSVVTAKGTFESSVLLNCTGAWGTKIAETFNEPVTLTIRGPQMGVTEPFPHKIHPVVGMWSRESGAYLRQVERGNIVFGGGVPQLDVDPAIGYAKIDPARLPQQLSKVVKLVPAIKNLTIIRQWSGCEGYVADGLPIMGPSSTTDGLFHAFGFCGHGFQLGPGVGDAMSELIATGKCETPLAPFAISRFHKDS